VKSSALQRQFTTTVEMPLNVKDDQMNQAGRIPPRRAEVPFTALHRYDESYLGMYTEEEVSAILQVSLSQLRKWRMKRNPKRLEGPPFKKIGRMVRYPAKALHNYIGCE
jgi:Helix-turn-helix domain